MDCLLHLIELCSNKSCFQFGNNFFEQFFGTAMGNPLLAGLFLEHVESEMLPVYAWRSTSFFETLCGRCFKFS